MSIEVVLNGEHDSPPGQGEIWGTWTGMGFLNHIEERETLILIDQLFRK